MTTKTKTPAERIQQLQDVEWNFISATLTRDGERATINSRGEISVEADVDEIDVDTLADRFASHFRGTDIPPSVVIGALIETISACALCQLVDQDDWENPLVQLTAARFVTDMENAVSCYKRCLGFCDERGLLDGRASSE